jgi:3-hydroxyacyl-CoA dehydrogenase/enoyl-CoA hydratase/3-hydroxybutyryl-CoA epimerase
MNHTTSENSAAPNSDAKPRSVLPISGNAGARGASAPEPVHFRYQVVQSSTGKGAATEGVALLTIDRKDEPVNTLSPELSAELELLCERAVGDPAVRALVIASGKADTWVAGAKLEMLQGVKTAADGERLSREAQRSFDRLASLGKPVVAAIHGACLGGGLEWALACHLRIATDDGKTVLGLPEVQLGLIPGAGGTQRLPALVGLQMALDLILSGKQLKAAKAVKIGLVDEVVPPAILVDVACRRALALAQRFTPGTNGTRSLSSVLPRKPASLATRVKAAIGELRTGAIEDNALGRSLLWRQAKAQLLKKTKGHYPAPEAAMDAIRAGVEAGAAAGYATEARLFGEMCVSEVSRRLVEIFFATTALKKDSGVDNVKQKPLTVEKLGVLGAGLMGSGIGFVAATNAGLTVRIKDRDNATVGRGLAAITQLVDERLARKSITRLQRDAQLSRVTAATDYSGFARCDLVIEAVFEDLEIKRQILRDVEAIVRPDCIFASNTSTIPIAQLAAASMRPETVCGMHFFSPVNKMPLLEVIAAPKSSPATIATAVAVGKKLGKTVIVVRDGVGFYTTRILTPYMNEAAYLLAEGLAIDEVDRALVEFGFPVGPITLLDEVGIDIGSKVAKIVHEGLGPRLAPPTALEKVLADGRLGRKNRRGFYLYDASSKGKKDKRIDETVYDLLPDGRKRKTIPAKELTGRVVLQMVNEAVRCLGEGILRSPRDGDIGAVFGLGFPAFRGGPFRYVDRVGAGAIVDELESYRSRFGARFEPAALLLEQAKWGKKFHG